MKLLKQLKKLFHIHKYEMIFSQYVSFNYRNVTYKCKCGKSYTKLLHHDNVYPFPTNFKEIRNNFLKIK